MAIFLGRQPILDRRRRTHGYELLYRSHDTGGALVVDQDGATTTVVERSMLEWGLENVVGSGLAFVNMTGELLRSDFYNLLPADRVVLELLEDTRFDAPTVDAVRRAVKAGFRVALDDVVSVDAGGIDAVLGLASVVKIDVMDVGDDDLEGLVGSVRQLAPKARLLAEKVETHGMFDRCRALKFDLFQGYFFARPEVMQRDSRPGGTDAALVFLAKVEDPSVDVDELAAIVAQDPTLVFRLLKLVNSSAIGLVQKVDSVRSAIVLLGRDRVRQLAMLLTLAARTPTNPELVTLATQRARMASSLVADPKLRESAFTTGLLSVIDVAFQAPMEELVDALPLADVVREALVSGTGPLGHTLRVVRAYETADVRALELLRPGGLDDLRLAFGDATTTADRLRQELTRIGV